MFILVLLCLRNVLYQLIHHSILLFLPFFFTIVAPLVLVPENNTHSVSTCESLQAEFSSCLRSSSHWEFFGGKPFLLKMDLQQLLLQYQLGEPCLQLTQSIDAGWKVMECDGKQLITSKLNERGREMKVQYCVLQSSTHQKTCWHTTNKLSNFQHHQSTSKHISASSEKKLLEKKKLGDW